MNDKQAHTPGPWHAVRAGSQGNGWKVYPEEKHSQFPFILVHGHMPNAEAIAHLCAAAPALLEALERCEQYLFVALKDARDNEQPALVAHAERDLKMLHAAIAAARPQEKTDER